MLDGHVQDGSGDRARAGIGVVANYYAVASLEGNVLVGNPKRTAAFVNSELRSKR